MGAGWVHRILPVSGISAKCVQGAQHRWAIQILKRANAYITKKILISIDNFHLTICSVKEWTVSVFKLHYMKNIFNQFGRIIISIMYTPPLPLSLSRTTWQERRDALSLVLLFLRPSWFCSGLFVVYSWYFPFFLLIWWWASVGIRLDLIAMAWSNRFISDSWVGYSCLVHLISNYNRIKES